MRKRNKEVDRVRETERFLHTLCFSTAANTGTPSCPQRERMRDREGNIERKKDRQTENRNRNRNALPIISTTTY